MRSPYKRSDKSINQHVRHTLQHAVTFIFKHSLCIVANLVLAVHLVLKSDARVLRILPFGSHLGRSERERLTRGGHVEKRDQNRKGVHRPSRLDQPID